MNEENFEVEGYEGEKITSVLKAVKKHCLECSGYQRDEVKLCTVTKCNLWPFRLGKNPYRKKKELTDEQRAAMRDRMSKYWSKDEESDEESDE